MNLGKETRSFKAVMSAHPNARPACAYIQGHIVNVVPPDNPNYNPKYDSIYNHGYGTPAGTLGINCRHVLTPYTPGINTNNQPQYDPKEAIKRGNLQQQQRAYERAIRQAKKKLLAAQYADKKDDVSRFKTLLLARQKRLRQFIKDANKDEKIPVLARDYAREQVAPNTAKQVPKLSKLSDKKSEKRYNAMYRSVPEGIRDESDNAPTPEEFKEITKDFIARGGIIVTEGPAIKNLIKFGNIAGQMGHDTILFTPYVGRAAIHEELIHVEQLRKEPKASHERRLEFEIDANLILLDNAKEWKLSKKEIETCHINLRRYRRDLWEQYGKRYKE